MRQRITQKQLDFAGHVAEGKTSTDAYRLVYNAEGMADNSIHREASLLMKNPKVTQRVSELRQSLEEKALWTREKSIETLVRVLKDGGNRDVIAAVQELNKMHGWNAPERSEVDLNLTVDTGVPNG